jgi:NAD(P)-dependent dehydrogenase (short-subunit alcohol dehydrogenase family)
MTSPPRTASARAETARVFLITGATGAIGLAIARQLAVVPSAEVVLACRDEARATQTFADILRASAPARALNVASYGAGDLELDNLQFTRRRYNNADCADSKGGGLGSSGLEARIRVICEICG